MKILFLGDSITDMNRYRESDFTTYSYGKGYVFFAAGNLIEKHNNFKIYNRGESGNTVVDLYARLKKDVWNIEPDVLSILIGINDIWHDLYDKNPNGVDFKRYEKVYRSLIEETKEKLPNTKIVLCEPFILHGTATDEKWDKFIKIKEYAKIVKNIANVYGLYFLPLQGLLEKISKGKNVSLYLYDGIHPNVLGAKAIGDAWAEFFENEISKGVFAVGYKNAGREVWANLNK